MKKIKINKGVYVCGPNTALTDHRVVYTVDDVLAESLIADGKAVEVVEQKQHQAVEDTSIPQEPIIHKDPAGTVEEVQHPVTTSRKKFNPRDHK